MKQYCIIRHETTLYLQYDINEDHIYDFFSKEHKNIVNLSRPKLRSPLTKRSQI